MSAISGIFRIDGGNVDPDQIKRMNNILSHRGPDGSGIFYDGHVALAHQMLHTTSESLNEKLPFKDENTGMVITADARIDNQDELAPILNMENSSNESDSLFILKAYQKWGENCPQKLLGDFTFAIWDPVNECLFCARDHMGVKPFYYYLSDDAFYFATEMKAILTLPDVPLKLNELKVAFHLMIEFMPEITFYEDILSLNPAHSIKIGHKSHEIKKYWKLDPELRIKMDSDEDYVKKFREIFEEAVKCRLRSAVPIGFELSGGLDSSSIVCMAKKIINMECSNFKHLNTFSFYNKIFKDSFHRHTEMIFSKGGINPTIISVDNISPLDKMKEILYYEEQPFYTPHMANMWNFFKIMKKHNIRIMLSGEGGDHIGYTGKHYFRELFVTLKWKKLIKELNYYSKRVHQSFLKVSVNKVLIPSIPLQIRGLGRKILQKKGRCYILNKDFANRLGGEQYLEKITIRTRETIKTPRKQHYMELTTDSLPLILEVYDRVFGAFPIEPRYPFRDKRLVEFAYAVPDDIKFRLGWDRYLHRISMTSIIPKEIQWNPKQVGSNYQRNLLLYEKKYLEKIIYHQNSIEDYVDSEIMEDLYQEFKSCNFNRESIYIWLALILNFWLDETDDIFH